MDIINSKIATRLCFGLGQPRKAAAFYAATIWSDTRVGSTSFRSSSEGTVEEQSHA
jgi:hypothetical protein